MKQILILLFSVLLFSCGDKPEAKPETAAKKTNWEMLSIVIDDEQFYIPTNQDTCYYYQNFRDTVYSKAHDGEMRSEKTKFMIKVPQKDSIIFLALDAITNPATTDQFLTCSAGQYVKIKLEKGSTTISCNYRSVSDWTMISPTLSKLNKKIFAELKKQ